MTAGPRLDEWGNFNYKFPADPFGNSAGRYQR